MRRSIPTVVWLIDSLRMGGAERLAVEFASRADAERVRVQLVALREGPQPLPVDCPQHVVGARNLRDLPAWLRLCRLLRELDADLVHTHLRYSHLWGQPAARRLGLACVSTLHTLPQPVTGWKERMLASGEFRQLDHADRVLAVSQAQARAWRGAGLRGGNLTILPNGVALQPRLDAASQRQLRSRLGLPEQACVFLTVAVVRGLKGWRHLLRAVPVIRQAHPQACFVWVGDGPEMPALRDAVRGAGLSGIVHLPGQRADVPLWLQAADVFLFPSQEEALPTALLEAMGAGLPVVASRLPAVEEVLGSEAGRRVAAGDSDALAAESVALAASAELRRQEGEQLRQQVRERFTAEVWTESLLATYEQILGAAGRRRGGSRAGAAPRPGDRPQPRLLAVEFFSRGGLFHYTGQLAQALARQGTEVTLLTGRHPEMSTAWTGVHVLDRLWTWNPHRRALWLPRKLQRWLRGGLYLLAWLQVVTTLYRERPDVVLLGDFEHRCDGWFVTWLARQGWPLADVWHNVASFDRYGGAGLVRVQTWRRAMARQFQTVFVHGETLAREFKEQTGQPAVVIPHGNQDWIARQAGADPRLSEALQLPPETPVALLFGSLTRYKGIDVLLQALGQLPARHRPVTVIAGYPLADCPIQELRQQADRDGLGPWLRWHLDYVPTPEIAWYFRRADFVVLPYRAASQSGVAHLALTFGKPLIVTRAGSLPELIDQERNGLVVEPDDPGQLAAALRRLTDDAGLRRSMGEAARQLARTRHDWDLIAQRVLQALPLRTRPKEVATLTETGATP